MSTIPAKNIVNVVPNVLSAGGSAVVLNGLILTKNDRVPIGAVLSFPSAAAVSRFFGGTSLEASLAATYFAGFDGSNTKPGAVLFAQYNTTAVSAYLRGGNAGLLSLAQLQAISGSFSVTIDDIVQSASINLSAALSFTGAAQIIQQALGIEGTAAAAFTGSITTSVLTVASGLTGTLEVGQLLDGAGVAAGTFIVNQLTGPVGGLGTYTVSVPQSVGSQGFTTTDPAVYFDSVSGGFVFVSATTGANSKITFASGAAATALLLTQATSAVTSQGAAAATPAAFMTALALVTQNWATFMLAFDPDSVGSNTLKLAFAQWTSEQGDRFGFPCWDTDPNPAAQDPSTTSLGYKIDQGDYSGTCLIWAASADLGMTDAAFVCGTAASIDFTQPNGRITFKFRAQAGLVASVTDETTAFNLGGNPATDDRGNGYNFYGAYGPADDESIFFANGFVSGRFRWFDSFINQIWITTTFQRALIAFLKASKSVPYNAAGRTAIEAALADVINQGLTFGAYRGGVTLSASQIARINADAGRDIAGTLAQRGWYLSVGDAIPAVRAARGSPPCTFWYVDGQSVQFISLAAVAVQ
ncbi:MAG: DUF3383 family protein [Pseudomonadota bacterium]